MYIDELEAERDELKARVRELEGKLAAMLLLQGNTYERAEKAETELAQLRERVAKAVEELQKWPHNSGLAVVDAALEALRGQ